MLSECSLSTLIDLPCLQILSKCGAGEHFIFELNFIKLFLVNWFFWLKFCGTTFTEFWIRLLFSNTYSDNCIKNNRLGVNNFFFFIMLAR
jgi:hypothetical protein